jgi:hypothetical protein
MLLIAYEYYTTERQRRFGILHLYHSHKPPFPPICTEDQAPVSILG